MKPKKRTVVRKIKPFKRNKRGIIFREGDRVVLHENAFVTNDPHPENNEEVNIFINRTAKIAGLLPNDDKKLVRLSRKLGGYWTWSVDELRRISR